MTKKKIMFPSPKEKEVVIEQWINNTDTQKSANNEMKISGQEETRKNDNTITQITNDHETKKIVSEEKQRDGGAQDSVDGGKRLTIDLPSSLHKAFKYSAVINDTTMVDLVREWIEVYVRKHNT